MHGFRWPSRAANVCIRRSCMLITTFKCMHFVCHACNMYTNMMMHFMQQSRKHSHTSHVCVSNVYNLYGNTASYVSPHVCMDFIYEMYALCASYADAALYASKYLYVKPRKKVHDPFRSTLSLLHFIVCTMYILYAMCMVVSAHQSWLWRRSGHQGLPLVAFDHRVNPSSGNWVWF